MRQLPLYVLLAAVALSAFATNAAADPCVTTLTDPGGSQWITDDTHGDVTTAAHDSYGGTAVGIGGYFAPDANSCTSEDGGREIVYPLVTVSGSPGVETSIKVFVP